MNEVTIYQANTNTFKPSILIMPILYQIWILKQRQEWLLSYQLGYFLMQLKGLRMQQQTS